MYKSLVFYTGGDTNYSIPFPYLKKIYVKVKVLPKGYTLFDFKNTPDLAYNTNYVVEGNKLYLKNVNTKDKLVCIHRETSTKPLVDFEDASFLKADNLNTFDNQVLHITEEIMDYARLFGRNVNDEKDVQSIRLEDTLPEQGGNADMVILKTTGDIYQWYNNKWNKLCTFADKALADSVGNVIKDTYMPRAEVVRDYSTKEALSRDIASITRALDDFKSLINKLYYTKQQTEDKFIDKDELKVETNNVQATFNKIQLKLTAVEDTVKKLDNITGGNSTSISTLKGDVSTLKDTVEKLDGTTGGHSTSISTLKGDVSTLKDTVKLLKETLDNFMSSDGDLDLTSVTKRLQEVEEAVKDVKTRVDNIDDNLRPTLQFFVDEVDKKFIETKKEYDLAIETTKKQINSTIQDTKNGLVKNLNDHIASTDAHRSLFSKCLQFYKDINLMNYRLTNVAEPSTAKDVTTKKYVDEKDTAMLNTVRDLIASTSGLESDLSDDKGWWIKFKNGFIIQGGHSINRGWTGYFNRHEIVFPIAFTRRVALITLFAGHPASSSGKPSLENQTVLDYDDLTGVKNDFKSRHNRYFTIIDRFNDDEIKYVAIGY